MTASVDWSAKVINVPQADLTLLSGNPGVDGALFECDTNVLRADLQAIEASVEGAPFERMVRHNTEVTVSGVTYARSLEIINGYKLYFEETGFDYTIRFVGSNNNFWETPEILIPTPHVSYISTNSAGLIVTAQSGLTSTESAALLSIDSTVAQLLTAQDLTNEQMEGEHITSRNLGKIIIRNTTVMRRWEADAFEDEEMTVPYGTTPNGGIEAVSDLVEVAWS